MKPVVDDLTIHSISCQNTFPKEKERFQNFSKSVKRFEEIDNVLADISFTIRLPCQKNKPRNVGI